LYGADQAGSVWERLEAILQDFHRRNPHLATVPISGPLSACDAVLITYGDQFQEPGVPPLQTLHQVLTDTLDSAVSCVHILPFYPYSSDDGFSVIDYTQVDPDLGTWADVERLGDDFRLMFDAVVNHISQQSDWFQGFLAGDPEFARWFIGFEPDAPQDWVSQVVRPRALPLLTPVQTTRGEKLVWTTFSDDQIDLNYAHPAVLLKIVEVLLFYVEKGAQLIRLDAIAYLWKKISTLCIHLEETHHVVKLMRCVLDAVAPGVILITETNVPHEDNISYFGEVLPGTGHTDEAQMVYQFPLAPLVMHSLLSGDAQVISQWAATLETPAPQATFFNFTASHDGIGVMPARGLLSEAEIQALVDATLAHGGRVSYKTNPDGSKSVYELNISYFDALSNPAAAADEPPDVQVERFIVSQAIMLALAGVPGIYVHSLLGSRSWHEGVAQTGRNRTINRQKLEKVTLERELADLASLRHQVFSAYARLLRARAADPAFHPQGGQEVLFLNDSVFALLRTSPEGGSRVLCLHNVSGKEQVIQLCADDFGLCPGDWRDLITDEEYAVNQVDFSLVLAPYRVCWLQT
jgi:sucrose phosphorylase